MEMFEWQIKEIIKFWECEKEDRVEEGQDSLIYEDYEQCVFFIDKLKNLLKDTKKIYKRGIVWS